LVIFQKRVAGLTEPALNRFIASTRRALALHGTVNVLVTSSRDMRLLNRQFRRKDTATDVLSFPAAPGLENRCVGEIAICADIAADNAKALGHPIAAEIKILALHGLLHLKGYDHETDDGRMAQREARLRHQFRLPLGLIERTNGAGSRRRRRA